MMPCEVLMKLMKEMPEYRPHFLTPPFELGIDLAKELIMMSLASVLPCGGLHNGVALVLALMPIASRWGRGVVSGERKVSELPPFRSKRG